MRKGIIALSGMVVGVVLLVLAFFGPWYMIHATGFLQTEYSAGFYLNHMELQRNVGGQDISLSMEYADAKMNVEGTAVNVDSFAMVETAMYLTMLAIVMAVIAIIFMAAFVFEKGNPKMMKLGGGLFAVLTVLLTLLPAVYFMNTEFVENISGFWFGMTIPFGIEITGSPGYAWYLMIVVAIIAVICAAAILLKKIPGKEAVVENS